MRQISLADTWGLVFNGCVLPRLVISKQPRHQNHTLHSRPCIRNLTTSCSEVMKAYASHRLALSHSPVGFDVRIHAEPQRKPRIGLLQVERAVGVGVVMYSNQTDVFLPQRHRLSFESITFMAQFIRALVYVSRSLVVSSTRGSDEPFPHIQLLSHF